MPQKNVWLSDCLRLAITLAIVSPAGCDGGEETCLDGPCHARCIDEGHAAGGYCEGDTCRCIEGSDGDSDVDADGDSDADADGDADVDGDDDGDTDVDIDADDDVHPGTCEEAPIASGVLHNTVADIDFTGELVTYSVEHKLDIDLVEDGCIAYAEFRVQKEGLGCELYLEFGVPLGGPLILLDAHLHADSFCPGWLDSDEGDYELVSGDPFITFPRRVPDRTAEQSCIGDATASFEGSIRLEDGGRILEIDLGDISFFGDVLSYGNTELTCPCWPSCDGRECGPDPDCGWPCGECGDGERCSDAGVCECSPDCGDRECGMDPVCGTLSCGACELFERCNEEGSCECVPDCGLRECGIDPVCSTLACGTCTELESCDLGTGMCECVPDCGSRECGLDPVCGSLSCGVCPLERSCIADSGMCCVPECGVRECGVDPVCGTRDCGSCGPDELCNAEGECECAPDCTGRECGEDPACGEMCLPGCGADQYCSPDGTCEDFSARVRVVAGTFTIGSPIGELGRGRNESQHDVTLTHDFLIQATEVTQSQFEGAMGYNPSLHSDCPDCPVEQVRWHEAAAYCNEISDGAGHARCYECTGIDEDVECEPSGSYPTPYDCLGYRLPTEAEWEYAARAGSRTATYNGDLDNDRCRGVVLNPIAWYCGNAEGATHAVGTRDPNAWSLYDMLGNVWEWCHDWYGTYPGGSVTDPWGPSTGSMRIMRGGSWVTDAVAARAASRMHNAPGYFIRDIGFRVARTLP